MLNGPQLIEGQVFTAIPGDTKLSTPRRVMYSHRSRDTLRPPSPNCAR
jgi:hypothetical protein